MNQILSTSPRSIILIAASSGGPTFIREILESLTKEHHSTFIIAQHIRDEFIPSFADNLQQHCQLPIAQAENEITMHAQQVYVATQCTWIDPRDAHMVFLQHNCPKAQFNPDINCLFHSAAKLLPKLKVMSIILSGIGEDGVNGAQAIAQSGGYCIAQSEQSATIDGMPKRARERVKGIKSMDMPEIIQAIDEFARREQPNAI